MTRRTLVAALVVFYTVRLSTERDRARQEAARSSKVSDLLIGLLTSADPYRTPDSRDPDAQSPLDLAVQRWGDELAVGRYQRHRQVLGAHALGVVANRIHERPRCRVHPTEIGGVKNDPRRIAIAPLHLAREAADDRRERLML